MASAEASSGLPEVVSHFESRKIAVKDTSKMITDNFFIKTIF
jgi:hypothetical protein